MRVPRTRGVFSGLVLVLLGAWGAVIAFIGPYFNYAYTPDNTWTYNSDRLWMEILPGAAAFLGGLIVLGSANRAFASLGSWLAVLGGGWFVVGPTLSAFSGMPNIGTPTGGNTRQVLESLGFFTGLGVVIVFFAALAMGRFAVVGVREVRAAERDEAEEQLATMDSERFAAMGEAHATEADSTMSGAGTMSGADAAAGAGTMSGAGTAASTTAGSTMPRSTMEAAPADSAEAETYRPMSESAGPVADTSTDYYDGARGGTTATSSTGWTPPASAEPARSGADRPADQGVDWNPPAEPAKDPYGGWTQPAAEPPPPATPVAPTSHVAPTVSASQAEPVSHAEPALPEFGQTAGQPPAEHLWPTESATPDGTTTNRMADGPMADGAMADGQLPTAPPIEDAAGHEDDEGRLHRLLHRHEHSR